MSVKFTSHKDDVIKEMFEKRQRALNAVGLMLERNAKIEINKAVYDKPPSPTYPVRTGRLRASITFATATEHSEPGAEAKPGDADLMGEPDDDKVYIGTNVEYSSYVCFGTSRTPARPYLRPALENHMSEYETIIETEMKRP